jgi:DNA-binding CsgD family transcriptional regulator/tetratricopeptide (TPR) repeat protein
MVSVVAFDDPPSGLSSPVPFVGREREVAELRAAFEQILAGYGQVALLIGEPGIGKTRVSQQFVSIARSHGARVLWGRCIEWDGAPAYWPWIQMVRTYLRDRDPVDLFRELGAGAADIAEIVPDVRSVLSEVPPAIPIAAEQARFRLFDSLTQFLQRAANSAPLVLVIDDLHWADPSSLLLLQFLAAEIAASPVLILGTARDADLGPEHPVSQALAELSRVPHARRITLRGLAEQQTRHLMSLMSGRVPSDAIVGAIHQQSGGNPFFIAELIRLLLDEEHRWDVTAAEVDGIRLGVPESVRQVVRQRLARLSPACREILMVAAVIGAQFSVSMVTRLSEAPHDVVLSALDEAVRARMLEVAESLGRYRFSHALIQDVLYDALGSVRQVQLHARIGAAIEQLHAASPNPPLAEIAYHYWRAAPGTPGTPSTPSGTTELALAAAQRAGDHAISQTAYEEASVQYQRALQMLDLLDQPVDDRRGELLLRLAEAQRSAGSPDGRTTFLEAADDARRIAHPERLARAALGFAGGSMLTGYEDIAAVRLLREAVEATEARFPQLHARCLARLAIAVRHDEILGRAETGAPLDTPWWRDIDALISIGPADLVALSQDVVAVARQTDDPEVLGLSLHALHSAGLGVVDVEEAAGVAAEMVAAAEASGHRELMATAYTWRTFELLIRGDIAAVDHYLGRAEQLVAELRQPFYAFILTTIRAHRALTSGQMAEGTTLADRAREISCRIAVPPPSPAESSAILADFYLREQQRHDELVDQLEALATFYAEGGNPPYRAVMLAMVSAVHAEQGRHDAAHEATRPLLAILEAPVARGPGSDLVYAASHLAETCYLLDDREAAGRIYPILAPLAPCNLTYGGNYMSRGSAAHYLGMLASTLTRYDDAERHFTDALAMNARMEMPPFVARTQFAYAAMLLGRRGAGDVERAHVLAEHALETTRELGLGQTAAWAQRLVDRAATERDGISSRAPDPARHGLSARELEVLLLIAEGLADRQIAESLSISHRTVSTHVASILNKLGVSSRAAAVALAVRQGII